MTENNDVNEQVEQRDAVEVDGASAGTACQTTQGTFAYVLTAVCLGTVAAVACALVLLAFAALKSFPENRSAQILRDELTQELRDYGYGQDGGTGTGNGGNGYDFDHGYNDQGGDGWGGMMGGNAA